MALAENRLIALLPRRDRVALLAACEPVQMEFGTMLCEPGRPTRHAYFPNDCVISLVTAAASAPGLEVGMAGREGMLGAELALGVSAIPWRALVKGERARHGASRPRRFADRSWAARHCSCP